MLIDGFASVRTARAILVLASFVGLASVGQTLVIVMGGIDLSIPFLVGVANVVAAEAFGAGLPGPLVVVIVVGLTATIGACNGYLSKRFDVHPLIITLGIGTAAVAAVLWWTAGFPSGYDTRWVTAFVSIGATTGPIPVPPIVSSGLPSPWPSSSSNVRRRTDVASSRSAPTHARPSWPWCGRCACGWPRSRSRGRSPASPGCSSWASPVSASGTVGEPLLFQTIAAVVIGGTSLIGGLGGYARTAMGAIVLILLSTLLLGLGVSSSLIQAALGVLIIVLVSVYGREVALRDTI